AYFDCCPDNLSTDDLKRYFAQLIASHSWSTVKLDRNGLQFFYRHVLYQHWEWLNIVKPPQVKRLPDILTPNKNQSQPLLIIHGPNSAYLFHIITT
ncbi:phage integrase N-terminal SAM-like domain-containing protein, partial [Shewanella colwelliana]|uniref:phage integrase N-terminal SAM-like domain-containing protein n=1 Tax=Shewanella colwelliana TaxID=23 RepID=UPI001B7FB54B